jgi:hypothetical protein
LKLNIHEYNEEIDGGEWIKQWIGTILPN